MYNLVYTCEQASEIILKEVRGIIIIGYNMLNTHLEWSHSNTNESTLSLLIYKSQQVKKANWLEYIGEGQKRETTCIKCIKYILFVGSKQRYLVRSLVVEIHGARRATGEKFEIPLNKSEKVINSK